MWKGTYEEEKPPRITVRGSAEMRIENDREGA